MKIFSKYATVLLVTAITFVGFGNAAMAADTDSGPGDGPMAHSSNDSLAPSSGGTSSTELPLIRSHDLKGANKSSKLVPTLSPDSWLDGTDPAKTGGCAPSAYSVNSWSIWNSKYGQEQGRFELMYSPACGTNWINFYPNTAGNTYRAYIYKPGGYIYSTALNGAGAEHTKQVYAPGSDCVKVRVKITDNATNTVEGDNGYYDIGNCN